MKYIMLLCSLIFLGSSNAFMGLDQNYKAILKGSETLGNDLITVESPGANLSSNITWGGIYKDKIELFAIASGENGNMLFNIEPVENVYVLLESYDQTEVSKFGFHFEQNMNGDYEYVVVANSESISNTQDTYIASTEFNVVKDCDHINFYVDGDPVYAHCIGQGETIPALKQHTSVIESNEKVINLNFTSGILCVTNLVLETNSASKNANTDYKKMFDQKYAPYKYMLIDVFDMDNKPRRQFKRRTSKEGNLLGTSEVLHFISKGNYRVTIREEL